MKNKLIKYNYINDNLQTNKRTKFVLLISSL